CIALSSRIISGLLSGAVATSSPLGRRPRRRLAGFSQPVFGNATGFRRSLRNNSYAWGRRGRLSAIGFSLGLSNHACLVRQRGPRRFLKPLTTRNEPASATPSLFRDETVGALDPTNAKEYVRMLRRAMDLGAFHQVIFICHTPLVWELADQVLEIKDGRVRTVTNEAEQ